MRTALRIVALNLGIFLALLLILNVLAITFYQGIQMWRGIADPAPSSDPRAMLPNYHASNWAITHFSELAQARVEYHSYYGWRRMPFNGDTITVDDRGIRHTDHPGNADAPLVVFLGGSTMWGEGSDDGNTIPAWFSRLSAQKVRVENLGESAYNAFQSHLFLKFRLLEGWKPDFVISYDGVNEVHGRCMAGNRPWGHGREFQMKGAMRGLDQNPAAPPSLTPSYFILPLQELLTRILRRTDKTWENPYRHVCHQDEQRAMNVARGLLDTWLTTRNLVVRNGGRYIAVLQPVAYIGNPNIAHLALPTELQDEYKTVYALIRELLHTPEYAALQGHVVDLTDAFDGDEHIYVDFAHVSPRGNEIIASRLGNELIARNIDRYTGGFPREY